MPDRSSLVDALAGLKPPGHLCAVYESEEERFQVAVPFIRLGLDRKEKCFYIASKQTIVPLMQALADDGLDVEAAVRSGALTTISVADSGYLKDGYFDPDRMYGFVKQASDEAHAHGFAALRVCGEIDWLEDGLPGLEGWMEYERRIGEVLDRNNCIGLCQYGRRGSSPAVILDVIRTHPTIIFGGTVCRNFWFVPRKQFLDGDSAAGEAETWLRAIQEHALAQEALCASELKYREILESISDGFNVFDREWRYTYVNTAGARMVGKTPEELLGKNVWELWPAAADSPFGVSYRRAMEERVQVTVEAFYGEPLNRWYNVRCYPRPEGLSLFFTDVTERKHAEEALQRAAQFLEESPSPVLRITDGGTILFANPPGHAFLRALGAAGEKPLPAGLQSLVANTREQDQPIESELEDSNGRVFSFMASRPRGERYVNLYGRDITDSKRAERTIRELSTPVLPARNGLLIVPLIGAIDPPRAKQLTEQVLTSIRHNRAKVVVIDVTGVLSIDSAVANHLLQTAEASRLLGAEIILTGISTSVAHTLVAIGANLGGFKTLGDLQSGIEEANRLLDHTLC